METHAALFTFMHNIKLDSPMAILFPGMKQCVKNEWLLSRWAVEAVRRTFYLELSGVHEKSLGHLSKAKGTF